jgi:phosphoesterase RecJ-like protein
MEFDSKIADAIRLNHEFVILSHVRPDGDAYGSTLALGLALLAAGKTVHLFNQDGMTKSFRFLPGSDLLDVTPVEPPSREALVIAVDTANFERLGRNFVGWNLPVDLSLDHHAGNQCYAKFNVIQADLPATAQLLYRFILFCGLTITPDVATNLFVGLSTDTGSFRFRQTSTDSFRMAAALSETGIDVAALAQSCYQSHPVSRLRLLREVLNTIQFRLNDRVVYYYLTKEMFEKSGAAREETEGLIEYLQSCETVEVAFVLEELDNQRTRVSLRSRGRVDVNRLASQFGGGGHTLAAGINSALSPWDLEKALLVELENQLK